MAEEGQNQETQEAVFLDKIKLSAVIVDREMGLSKIFSILNEGLREYKYRPTETQNYRISWALLEQLYSMLKHDSIQKLQKKHPKKHEKLTEIMQRYNNIGGEEIEKVTYNDLKEAIDLIHFFVSVAGFHDVTLKDSGEESFANEE